ncbi:MAG: S1C family serine protease [Gemmataceae bacterium]|nr:S1C family serine protease [Gemmataceae bacterium]
MLRFSSALLALVACLLVPASASAQKGGKGGPGTGVEIKSSPKFLAAFRKSVAKPAESTVRVQCNGKDTALGIVVTADGFILTKHSDLDGKITVKMRDGESLEAKLVGVHETHDLAMLKIEATGLTPATWRESKLAPVGHWVASPGMGADPVAVGVVSVAARELPKTKIQKPLPKGGGFLGIGLEDTETGAVIGEVQPKSAASKAGLKVKDIILAVGGKETPDAEALIRAIASHKPKEKVVLKVKRGDEELELEATLRPRPKGGLSRGDFQNALGSELSKRRTGFTSILQHDTVLKPSDCGGPLVDLEGNVIGVNIARGGRTESWAIPAETVRPLLRDLMTGKLPPRGKQ